MLNRETGKARQDLAGARHGLSYAFRKQDISEYEIEACELGLTQAERTVYLRLREAGKTVIRAGWPDLLVIDGEDVYAIEVKTPSDKLNPRQLAMHKALAKTGLRVDVEVVT